MLFRSSLIGGGRRRVGCGGEREGESERKLGVSWVDKLGVSEGMGEEREK